MGSSIPSDAGSAPPAAPRTWPAYGIERAAAPLVKLAVGLAVAFFLLPLLGLLLRTPWNGLASELGSAPVRSALWLSLVCSLAATGISILLGVPLAWALARWEFPGRSLVRALTTLPMIVPPVVGGVALLLAFGRRGFAGRWLDEAFGITLPFTMAGAILAETFVAMPFLVITVEAGLRSMNRRFEEAAATLGARPWVTFRRVTLPLIGPSLWAGAALAWARALGEFGATITFAGNLPGRTQTIPLAVYLALETRLEAAIALSVVLLAVSLTVLIVFRSRFLPNL
ncbi:MAG TPA: ABC transporter permease [Actinomycetota bacterium]|nr:ABC transporter permease [Actinomycetota bacterium]